MQVLPEFSATTEWKTKGPTLPSGSRDTGALLCSDSPVRLHPATGYPPSPSHSPVRSAVSCASYSKAANVIINGYSQGPRVRWGCGRKDSRTQKTHWVGATATSGRTPLTSTRAGLMGSLDHVKCDQLCVGPRASCTPPKRDETSYQRWHSVMAGSGHIRKRAVHVLEAC